MGKVRVSPAVAALMMAHAISRSGFGVEMRTAVMANVDIKATGKRRGTTGFRRSRFSVTSQRIGTTNMYHRIRNGRREINRQRVRMGLEPIA